MFLDFLIYLRSKGFKASLNEWLTLMEAMYEGLHCQSVNGFYVLCRTLLVKKESDLDKFEELFNQYFSVVDANEFIKELTAGKKDIQTLKDTMEASLINNGVALDELMQSAASDNKAMASSKTSKGIGAGHGTGSIMEGVGGKSIIHARGDRKFRDWRDDCTIESRQFQMAFRLLREMSRKLENNEEEFDIFGTIDSTCRRGGILDIRMQPPRKNRLKLMVLIDSGGSMKPYEQLCSLLFQSLNKANTFSDLKIYYFHNCLEGVLYKNPEIETEDTLKTEWVLRNISSDYKVIFVGDAEMSMYELMDTSNGFSGTVDGITWFKRFKEKYHYTVWLHPQEREENLAWMSESFVEIDKLFPMYRLSIEGLKEAMYRLMKSRR